MAPQRHAAGGAEEPKEADMGAIDGQMMAESDFRSAVEARAKVPPPPDPRQLALPLDVEKAK